MSDNHAYVSQATLKRFLTRNKVRGRSRWEEFYNSVRPSVGPRVGPNIGSSAGPRVGPNIGPSVEWRNSWRDGDTMEDTKANDQDSTESKSIHDTLNGSPRTIEGINNERGGNKRGLEDGRGDCVYLSEFTVFYVTVSRPLMEGRSDPSTLNGRTI